jgi:NAD(P)-dependent dehydrogenase (short-subunit alcohol dehydrogenase family)
MKMTALPAQDLLSSMSLQGKRAWVTGASTGLGRAIAQGLLAAGSLVAVTARSVSALDDLAAEEGALGREVIVLPGSVSDSGQVQSVAAQLEEIWGGLDILVNCAGVSPTFNKSVQVSDDEWQSVIDVNLSGTFYCARAAAELMFVSGGGSIINISSIHGSVGMPRLAAYAASKGGTDALTRTLALEWADQGVRVNSIAPGYFKTRMTEGLRESDVWSARLLSRIALGRFGEASEVVPAVLFLSSDAASYITGATLAVDGGWTAG